MIPGLTLGRGDARRRDDGSGRWPALVAVAAALQLGRGSARGLARSGWLRAPRGALFIGRVRAEARGSRWWPADKLCAEL